jgi:hypothetical protein
MRIARFLGDSFGNSDYSFGSRPEMRIARFLDDSFGNHGHGYRSSLAM